MINKEGETLKRTFKTDNKPLNHLEDTGKKLEKREKILLLRQIHFEIERERIRGRERFVIIVKFYGEVVEKGVELCALWGSYLQDPSWYSSTNSSWTN
ncbi:hypothetical protein Ddye_022470 [Dipteronia dyeriana]|uniref:Uncharacterized protein n=1 Tax=Dipteronia dyeriana TaxID=168575 RepID=A0AAD9TRL5_9ROSI|nr:hypothetical protein Ddye_022470 [Dipteronia dyeriana]